MPDQMPKPSTPPTWFDAFMDKAERSNPFTYNLVMISMIIIVSTGLTLAVWTAALAWMGFDAGRDWPILSLASGMVVSALVATPAVLFGSALVTRVEMIRDDLRAALTQTRIANRAKTEFLANMSHEIRTPLNGVLGMAQILEQSELNAEQHDSLRMIAESGTLLMAIINDVLDLSKVEAGQISLDPRTESLEPMIRNTVALFQARAQENGNALVFDCDPDLPEKVIYDSVRTRQCVANLVSNAVKFTQNGRITVNLSAVAQGDDWHIRVQVRDTGIGIEAATLQRLFQPFAQADASTCREFGGTGLGLALSRRFARLMGGDITVESVLGQGSCFELTFAASAASLIEAPPDSRHAQNLEMGWLARMRILVVDDSRVNRKVVQGLLRPFGPTCIEAENGLAALKILDRMQVDLVLLDMHMPVMDGRTMLSELRKRPGPEARLPVIALTADLIQSRRSDFMELGFQGFLTKPLKRYDLQAELFATMHPEDGSRPHPALTDSMG